MANNSTLPHTGKIGEALTVFKLRRIGVKCQQAQGFRAFDIIAIDPYSNKTIRVQVKSTSCFDSKNTLRFRTCRGRFTDKGKNQKLYTSDQADIIALVSLVHNQVIFKHASQILRKRTVVKAKQFQSTNTICTYGYVPSDTFFEALKKV